MSAPRHTPVLCEQVLSLLDPQPGMICLDCTVGLGGHGAVIAPRLAPNGRYVALDADPANVAVAGRTLQNAPVQVDTLHANFAESRQVLDQLNIEGADLVFADLGFASSQMEDPQRGLSFSREGPLDMRFDPTQPGTAMDLVQRLSQQSLADLIYEFGEERRSRKIARNIVECRRKAPIHTTTQLAQIVREAYGRAPRRPARRPEATTGRRGPSRIDPATRTFQALRIAVNGELDSLQRLLNGLPRLIRPGGTAAIISFHSLEDRRVKRAFTELRRDGRGVWLTRKPLIADATETTLNPRSRSAKLRAIRFVESRPAGAVDGEVDG